MNNIPVPKRIRLPYKSFTAKCYVMRASYFIQLFFQSAILKLNCKQDLQKKNCYVVMITREHQIDMQTNVYDSTVKVAVQHPNRPATAYK